MTGDTRAATHCTAHRRPLYGADGRHHCATPRIALPLPRHAYARCLHARHAAYWRAQMGWTAGRRAEQRRRGRRGGMRTARLSPGRRMARIVPLWTPGRVISGKYHRRTVLRGGTSASCRHGGNNKAGIWNYPTRIQARMAAKWRTRRNEGYAEGKRHPIASDYWRERDIGLAQKGVTT